MSAVFFDISRESSEEREAVDRELLSVSSWDEDWLESFDDPKVLVHAIELLQQKDRLRAKEVTFATMCLEAFIYDFAAHHLGDTYVKKYLDKLDFVAKWVLVPRLALGRELPRGSQAFEHLTYLVRERNDLVHAKSIILPSGEPTSKTVLDKIGPVVKKEIERERLLSKPYEAIVEVLRALEAIEFAGVLKARWWELTDADPSWRNLGDAGSKLD
jgi:hypothetical protein